MAKHQIYFTDEDERRLKHFSVAFNLKGSALFKKILTTSYDDQVLKQSSIMSVIDSKLNSLLGRSSDMLLLESRILRFVITSAYDNLNQEIKNKYPSAADYHKFVVKEIKDKSKTL